MKEKKHEELPTCKGCIYSEGCFYTSPNAHWSNCGMYPGWVICPFCEGHGEILAQYPTHPEDMQDYEIPCPASCYEGHVYKSKEQ